ncbi:MAG: geranylgeranyl reductase family protein [Ginsengibacter sp.]
MKEEKFHYDVIIVGAGPAGCACALYLKDAGLKVAVFEKKTFPRDKICGDAIPSRAIKVIKQLSPGITEELHHFQQKMFINKTRIIYGRRFFDFTWVGDSYTSKRIDFDNFLLTMVRKFTSAEIFENRDLGEVKQEGDYIKIENKLNQITYTAKMIIGADGANSIVAKQLVNRTIDRDHHVGSVRAYYSNVTATPANTTEVFLDKKFFPGYFWIFPLTDNMTNVGYGMLSSEISKRKINLRKAFLDIIETTPALSERFKNASLVGDVQGFGLPLGSRKVQMSGQNFILVGDAASLIDPISGEGIGNAMLSGKLAAEQTVRCFNKKDFSASFIAQYDSQVFKALGPELKLAYRIQTLMSKMPFLLDVVFLFLKNTWVCKQINKLF